MKYHLELPILQKSALGALAILLSATALFGTVLQSVKAAELSKTEIVKTEYAASQKQSPAAQDNFEVDYHVTLEEGSPKADPNAITAEEAAKLGVQDLKRIFAMDSRGKTISMYYSPIGETAVRAEWFGSVLGDGAISYYFSVDALSGAISATCRDIKLNKQVNVGFDNRLLTDSSEFQELTKKVIEDYQILPEEIVSVTYASQGYINDNPDIQMRAIDAKGNEAQLSFSRYDKKLLQVCYDNWVKAMKLVEDTMMSQ